MWLCDQVQRTVNIQLRGTLTRSHRKEPATLGHPASHVTCFMYQPSMRCRGYLVIPLKNQGGVYGAWVPTAMWWLNIPAIPLIPTVILLMFSAGSHNPALVSMGHHCSRVELVTTVVVDHHSNNPTNDQAHCFPNVPLRDRERSSAASASEEKFEQLRSCSPIWLLHLIIRRPLSVGRAPALFVWSSSPLNSMES